MHTSSRSATLWAAVSALALLSACSSGGSGGASDSRSAEATAAPSTAAPQAPAGPRTKNWFDLQVGDCVTEIPAVDVGVVTVTLVDCATPHQAEVYLLAPLKVDTATDTVATEKCTEGFVAYTGQAFNGSPFRVTYVIDSNQDRTADNPTPSTAICFLEAANGGPLTKSARV